MQQSTASDAVRDAALTEAQGLFDTARDLRQKGQFDAALIAAERALALREKVIGEEDVSIADALHLVADVLDDLGRYGQAEPLNVRALQVRERLLGPEHPDVARSLFNLGWIAKAKSDFTTAEALYYRALAIQEKALGADHREVMTTLNDLGVLYSQMGQHDRAIAIRERVLAVREQANERDDAGIALALGNLARSYELTGDYARAELLFSRALATWEGALGADHPTIANAADGLARIYHATGHYARAQPMYLRALAIREKSLGAEHVEVGTTLNNLGTLYRDMGDYAQAETLHRRDLAITERSLGPDHPFMAPTLDNLAIVLSRKGRHREAEVFHRRALAIRERTLGPAHGDVGWSLNLIGQLGLVDAAVTDRIEIAALFERSITVLEKALGPQHHRVASPLAGLAALAEEGGDRDRAEALYRRAVELQERALGPDHPDVTRLLERLAALHLARGDLRQSLTLFARVQDSRERHLSHNLPLGSERRKREYLGLFAQDTNDALSLHARMPHDEDALHLAFTTLLRRKGRALDATRDNVSLLRARATPADQALFAELAEARGRFAALTLQGSGRSAAPYRAQLMRLEADVERIETLVAGRSAEFRAESQPVTLDAVRAVLPPDIGLIEFAWYLPRNHGEHAARQPRYVAYTLTAQDGPGWVDLGDAAAIDRATAAWRDALRNPKRTDARQLARALDAQIMEPVRARLGSVRRLLISPDGELNLVPFAALVNESSRFLVETYDIGYLTSGRDLLRLQVPRQSQSAPTIVAAPAFGEPALTRARPDEPPRVDHTQMFFGPLPGVHQELRALTGLMPDVKVLVGDQATEAAVKGLRGPRLLHIATHGFFLDNSHDPSIADPSARGPAPTPFSVPGAGQDVRIGRIAAAGLDDPLLRSGLALAGANQRPSGDTDGVLTGLEASGLDLWGTQLVVLSACDTGIGHVKRGDGVYGLRRALVLAGAESQLISLWAVSDRGTRDLMIAYYERLTRGMGRGEALRQAQLQLLRDPRHAHPYYWASFIQSGQWARLADR
jgi:CHAT domain-containing protein/tetratricopeptide (TPR) repeat protein